MKDDIWFSARYIDSNSCERGRTTVVLSDRVTTRQRLREINADFAARLDKAEAAARLAATSLALSLIALAIFFLSGCASQPIGHAPEADVSACQAISEQHGIAGRATARAGIEGARALGVATAINSIPGANVALWPIFAGYAVTSAINGAIEAQDRRDAIVRECLRDRGFRVY